MRAPLLVLAALTLALPVGCAGRDSGTDTSGLDSEAAALVDDNTETDDTEGDLEEGLEDPLSGAAIATGEIEIAAPDAETVAEKARTNPGVIFKPAGCIVSTRAANVVTHVFSNCSGPYGLASYSGTVTSTWTKIANGFQVVHATKGFHINGATIDHTVTIQYTRAAGVYTKTRKGDSTGTTAKGRAISHHADYVTTWDPATRCIDRNGSSSTTIGARAFSRSITDYERCGVGLGGCPKKGTFELTTPKLNLQLSFPGGPEVDITVNGNKFRRAMICSAS